MTILGELIATGTRSTVHAVGTDVVAKVPLPTTPDAWIRHEAMFTAAVRAAGAPAPQLVEVIELDGRTVSLYERVTGPSMWEYVVEHPDEAPAMGRRLAELHAGLLSLVPPVTLPRQHDRLACKIRAAALTVDPDVRAAIDLIPAGPDRPGLCHGDVHPGNVIMSGDGPVLIDWFDACRGNPVGDITRTLLLLGAGGATANSVAHLPGARHELLIDLHDSYLEAMTEALGLDPQMLEVWRRIEAAARLSEGLAVNELLAIWRRADERSDRFDVVDQGA